jgi:hypothetical protein
VQLERQLSDPSLGLRDDRTLRGDLAEQRTLATLD